MDTDAENHSADPEVDVFRGNAVAIYISHEGAVTGDTLLPDHPVGHNDPLLFTDVVYPYTNGIVFILTTVWAALCCRRVMGTSLAKVGRVNARYSAR